MRGFNRRCGEVVDGVCDAWCKLWVFVAELDGLVPGQDVASINSLTGKHYLRAGNVEKSSCILPK
jgi:hypothetical protein